MPVTVEIDGLGKVELDDSFKSKSAAEQEQIISDIVAQAHPQSHGGGGVPRDRSAPETYGVLERIVTHLYPQARITSDKRSPQHNAEVGGVPDSYHVSGHGIDVTGLSADERANLRSQMEDMGIKFDEFMFHKVKGGGLHLHMASTHVPEELFGDAPQAPEEGQEAPPADAPPAPGAPSGQPPADLPPKGPEESWGHSIASGAHDLVKGVGEGFTDFQNDATGLLLRGTDAIGLTDGSHDRFNRAREEVEDPAQDARYVHPDGWSRTIGNIGGNAIAGAPLTELKALEALGAGGKLARYGDMALQGASAGAITSGGDNIPENMAIGAVAAPVLGGAVDLGMAATPTARAARFAANQAEKNPYAAWDAEIVEDLAKAHQTINRSPNDPKARAPLDVKVINDVQDSYTDQAVELIKQLQLPKMEELRLRNALSRKHSLPQEEIDALRGSTAGDAVADAIVKTQRIKRLTPEIARDPSMLTRAGNAIGTGLDFIPGVPGIVGRGVRWASKATAGDAEAARVHAAQRLLNKQRGYAKLQETVGPSGQRESQQALWDEAAQAIAEKEGQAAQEAAMSQATKTATAKERAWSAKQKMEGTVPPKPSKVQTEQEKAWAAREKAAQAQKAKEEEAAWSSATPKPTKPDTTWKAEEQEFMAWAKERIAAKRAAEKAAQPAPEKAAKPAKPKPLGDQLIEKAIEDGIQGTSRTRQAFKDRLGIQDDAAFDKALDEFVTQFPDAKPEVDRIRLNHPTKDRTFGVKATPHLRSAMDKLGIKPAAAKPAAVPVDEAAQARLAGKAPETAPNQDAPFLKPDGEIDWDAAKRADAEAGWVYNQDGTWTNTKTGQTASGLPEVTVSADTPASEADYYKQIRRPEQWDASKDRRVGMATDAIGDLATKVRPEILERIKRLPEHARDNIKIGDDARKFYDTDVDTELRAAGATPEEIDAVRTTFYDIATVKPYQTQDEFNAGALTRGRGRPRATTK
jgi:hypothetical protein